MYYYDNINTDHSLILEAEPSLTATNNLQESQIIFTLPYIDRHSHPSLKTLLKNNALKNSAVKYVFILFHTHIFEGHDLAFYTNEIKRFEKYLPGKKIFIIHTNLNYKNKHNLVYTDFYFNRAKLYFTDYEKLDLNNRLWSYLQTKKTYDLNPIPKEKSLTKVWLILNRFSKNEIRKDKNPVEERQYLRHQFSLFCNYKNSFYGNPKEGKIIPGEEFSKPWHGWQPAANKYYNFSLISAYVETLPIFFDGGVRCVTEKTFDPLIKGHFILPFAYPTFIDDCKKYGFQFPEFINYEYDKITNNEERFTAWKNEYLRLDSIPKSTLENLYNMNLSILEHNRNIFWKRPYDYFIPKWQTHYKIIN